MQTLLLALAVSCACACACNKPVPSSQPADAAPPTVPSPPSATVLTTSPPPVVAGDAGPRRTATKLDPREPPSEALHFGPRTFWAEEDGDGSLLFGAFDGRTRLLRRTSGKVAAIDVLEDGGDVTVAWASDLGESKGQLVALVTASQDLALVSAPITVAIVAAQVAQEGHLALRKNPRGGLVVVHQGPTAKCPVSDLREPMDCVSFEVRAVKPDGSVERLGGKKLLGGPSPGFAALDFDGKALAIIATSMRGGPTVESLAVGYAASSDAPPIAAPICQSDASHVPELHRGSQGELAAVCIGWGGPQDRCARSPAAESKDRCLHVSITRPDGKASFPKGSALVTRIECKDAAHPRLSFEGGAVTLTSSSALAAELGGCQK